MTPCARPRHRPTEQEQDNCPARSNPMSPLRTRTARALAHALKHPSWDCDRCLQVRDARALVGPAEQPQHERSNRRRRMAKYGKKASEKVERAMKERKRGTLRSGRSGTRVTS